MTVVNLMPAHRSRAVLDLAQSDGIGVISKRGVAFNGEMQVHRVGDDLMLQYADGSAVRVCGVQS